MELKKSGFRSFELVLALWEFEALERMSKYREATNEDILKFIIGYALVRSQDIITGK